MENEQKNALKTVSTVMLIMLIGKITGLIRDIMTAGYLGTGMKADAFMLASRIPRDFLDFAFASAISSSFIPVFNAYLQKKGKEEAYGLADRFITIILIGSIGITILAVLFSTQIVAAFAPGFDVETRDLSVRLLLIMLPTIILTVIAFSVTGILQSMGEFNIPAAMSVVSNLIIILYYVFLMDRYDVAGLSIAFLLGWTTQVLIQVPSLVKKKYFFKPKLDLRDSGIREIGMLVVPVMLSSWVLPINNTVNGNVASSIPGGNSALGYAYSLYSVITGVVILSIANVLFPTLSRQNAMEDSAAFGETLRGTIRVLFFLLVPMTLGLFVLSRPIVELLYGWGSFGEDSSALTSTALMCYSLGMLGFGLQTILSRGFYAGKDGKTPLVTGCVAIVVNAVLSVCLVGRMGVGGPAMASSVSMTVTGFIMYLFMYKRHKAIFNKCMGVDLLKILAIALFMAVIVYGSHTLLGIWVKSEAFVPTAVNLIVSVVCGVVFYMLLAFWLGVEEAHYLLDIWKKISKRSKGA